MSKMILNDWIRGRIPYFRMPPMPNDCAEEPSNTINVKQLYNKIFVTSAFSKEDLKASENEIYHSSSPKVADRDCNPEEAGSGKEESAYESQNDEDDWDNVYQSVVGDSSTVANEDETSIKQKGKESEALSSCDSELELSDVESIESIESEPETDLNPKKKSRMTTNKKKIGVHYYENANVKNKNRNKKRPLNPNEVSKRLQRRKK